MNKARSGAGDDNARDRPRQQEKHATANSGGVNTNGASSNETTRGGGAAQRGGSNNNEGDKQQRLFPGSGFGGGGGGGSGGDSYMPPFNPDGEDGGGRRAGAGGGADSPLVLIQRAQIVNDDEMFVGDILISDGVIWYNFSYFCEICKKFFMQNYSLKKQCKYIFPN